MQGAPEHGPRPGPLLPEACSVALGQSEDPVAAELANAGEGAVPPDHQLPLARMCVGATGTRQVPRHLGNPNILSCQGAGEEGASAPCLHSETSCPNASCFLSHSGRSLTTFGVPCILEGAGLKMTSSEDGVVGALGLTGGCRSLRGGIGEGRAKEGDALGLETHLHPGTEMA